MIANVIKVKSGKLYASLRNPDGTSSPYWMQIRPLDDGSGDWKWYGPIRCKVSGTVVPIMIDYDKIRVKR